MLVARVSLRWLAAALTLGLGGLSMGCGDRSGDPIVRLPGGVDDDAGGEGGAPHDGGSGGSSSAGNSSVIPSGGTAGTGGSGGGPPNIETGPVGLCGACSGSNECGDANDACIRGDGEPFCGRDCDDQRVCPEGYACVELQNSQVWQCAPLNGCVSPPPATEPLSDVRAYVLSLINAERAERALAPIAASSCLDELAQSSAVAFASTDEPLGKFVKECDPVWPNCACDWTAEAEITVARYALDWTSAIDFSVHPASDGSNARFTQSFLDYDPAQVGIGFWISGDEAWLALSFR